MRVIKTHNFGSIQPTIKMAAGCQWTFENNERKYLQNNIIKNDVEWTILHCFVYNYTIYWKTLTFDIKTPVDMEIFSVSSGPLARILRCVRLFRKLGKCHCVLEFVRWVEFYIPLPCEKVCKHIYFLRNLK